MQDNQHKILENYELVQLFMKVPKAGYRLREAKPPQSCDPPPPPHPKLIKYIKMTKSIHKTINKQTKTPQKSRKYKSKKQNIKRIDGWIDGPTNRQT